MKQAKRLKTPAQVRADFERRGVSIRAWSLQHRVSASLVYDILSGSQKRRCLRGQSHRIAVLLGLKAGEIVSGPQAMNVAASGVSP